MRYTQTMFKLIEKNKVAFVNPYLKTPLFLTTQFWIITGSLILTLLMWIVSYYGNPTTDESFPFAIAYRFILGQRPFVDDFSPYISLGLLMYPLVKLSIFIHHGTDKLILSLRHFYLVFTCGIGLFVFNATKKYLPLFVAFFVAVFIAIYHPFSINTFHYDTLAVIAWSTILFQLINFLSLGRISYSDYFIFSFLSLILGFVYPTFIFLLLPFYIICSFYIQTPRLFWSINFASIAVAVLFLAWVIFYHFHVQWSDIKNTLDFCRYYFHSAGGSFAYKINTTLSYLVSTYSKYILFSSTLLIFAYFNQQRRVSPALFGLATILTVVFLLNASWVLSSILISLLVFSQFFRTSKWLFPFFLSIALLSPLLGSLKNPGEFSKIFYFFNCAGFLGAIIFLLFFRQHRNSRYLFGFIWLPSFIAGFLTSVTSCNLGINFNIGFFPTSILGFVFAFQVLQKHCLQHNFKKGLSTFMPIMILVYGLIMLTFFQVYYAYGSDFAGIKMYQRSEKYLVQGPFNGLYLSPLWGSVLKHMQLDISKIDTDTNKFIYFGHTPGGYLLLKQLKPGDFLLFSSYFNHYSQPLRMPNYVVVLMYDPTATEEKVVNAKSKIFYHKLISNPYYNIYYAQN